MGDPRPTEEIHSDLLRQNKDRILSLWAERVRSHVPAARRQTRLALLDALPQFLDRMAQGIQCAAPELLCHVPGEVCKEHGEQRAGLSDYSLDQVILEYKILLETILDVLESTKPLDPFSKNCVIRAILEGISEAVAEYVRTQDRMREQFIAILTHDLRNPLSAARTCAEMILRRPDTPESLATKILGSIRRIDEMLRDLLDTFQLRAGKPLPVEIAPNDLVAVAKEALDELTAVHGPRFILDAPESARAMFCDDGVRRAVENLANNAVKYGDPCMPITIRVRAEGAEVSVAVHNHGNPLIAEDQAELFRPFHRTPFAQTSGKRGWGLGLTLVQGVAIAHGGHVTVRSSAEEGTTFTLHLPRE